MKFREEVDEGDGWSRWIQPVAKGYKLGCCDCGLVHTMEFRVTEDDRAQFRVRLNRRSTAQMRRHMRAKGTLE